MASEVYDSGYRALNGAALERISELEGALRRVSEKQPQVLQMIRDKGFIFEDIGSEPGNWQHLAFTLYTELCELDMISREALGIEVGEE